MTETVRVVVSRRFDALPERVFDAWLDPAIARRWLFTTTDTKISVCEIDGRVGGAFKLVDHRPDGDITHVGTYLAIERPHLLVFTFAVPQFSPLHDRVTVEIEPDGAGCVLTLTNEMDAGNAEWIEPAKEGWTMMLASLERELT
ncbi:SRPBCC family protein [Tianweitania sediminis]|uniref:SRPBCC domain-containing protein n=1 Tax=Tianweitania sediminis TaxID=1502156 RepID=A0A8J7UKG1_9HYPH|nr:SRPBCC family protein [Tianweitania sediminis]MBP0441138.1 SRPBCC domain-containing protein [Tianweitania sediminis]